MRVRTTSGKPAPASLERPAEDLEAQPSLLVRARRRVASRGIGAVPDDVDAAARLTTARE